MNSKTRVVYPHLVAYRTLLEDLLEELWHQREVDLMNAVEQLVRDVMLEALQAATKNGRLRRPRRRRK